jgi:uncharacterized protein (DUF2252 family)
VSCWAATTAPTSDRHGADRIPVPFQTGDNDQDNDMKSRTPKTVQPGDRAAALADSRNLKMARSAHAYVRGNTKQFYEWLKAQSPEALPEGPAVWICGDCHLGNLGPIASVAGGVEIQIRDLDQAVIGNPAHDLIRLGLSLAMAARGSDLPGVTTAVMLEQLMEGYCAGLEGASLAPDGSLPAPVHLVMKDALRRSWKHLARDRFDDVVPAVPIGKRFWRLTPEEKDAIAHLFEKKSVSRLATLLGSRADDAPVEVLDAAYWMKGCSSLGLLRYAVVLGVGERKSQDRQYCLVDIKEAVPAAAPAYPKTRMPPDHAMRVVDGARHLSPHLGDRMLAAELMQRPVFLRELLPQDLKLEIEQLTRVEATEVAAFLGGVVGKAHARQMDEPTAMGWRSELRKDRSKTLDAPGWLWTSIVDLVASHEAGYLHHCRRYALREAA